MVNALVPMLGTSVLEVMMVGGYVMMLVLYES